MFTVTDAYAEARHEFEDRCPEYDAPALEALRRTEYGRLDAQQQVYLDYTGGGLYADSQLSAHMDMLRRGIFGNPHSANPTSAASTQLDEHARQYVLDYFNASPDEYLVIFTLNASGALKLVGESYPFEPGGHYLLTFDNHNSVNGIREFARAQGAAVTYAPVIPPELRIDTDKLREHLQSNHDGKSRLFAYPAQSNFSGVQHALEWIAEAQANGWDVLLDAAAFAPTNRLDLSQHHPDFVSLSFYKMFGYPTGVGCLIIRKAVLPKLRRPWFAGGTITLASVQGDGYFLDDGVAAFEDGTINYLNLPAIEIGLRYIEQIGIERIHNRVMCLTDWLIRNLVALRHSNGRPLATIYGPTDTCMRGGTVTFNFYDVDGKLIDFRWVEDRANGRGISLRTGCFCNPGAGEMAAGLTKEELLPYFHGSERMTFEQFITAMSKHGDKAVGAIRVSVGIASNFADVYQFVEFARTFLDTSAGDTITP
ncbi:MAG: aminotransferase class V-fold PLP-dependent enzyme [Chloroflexi bacterium]|nr:aminotransferase class V-fold PLP-dependent enzyme [Chloroflexota bacterium]